MWEVAAGLPVLALAALALAGCGSSARGRLEDAERWLASGPNARPPAAESERTDRRREAAPSAVAPDDLDGYLRLGLARSSRLRGAFERFAAAVEQGTVARGVANPRLSWVEFVEDLETRAGPVRRRLGVAQALPFFGVRAARGGRAEAAAEVAWSEVERVRLELLADVERAWAAYAYRGSRLELVERQLALLQELEPIVQGRIQGGGPQSDLLQLQVEIGRLVNERASARGALVAASAELEAAVEWRGPSPLPVPELGEPGAALERFGSLDRDRLLDSAVTNAPRLRTARARIALGEADVKLSDANRWSDLELGLEWFDTGDAVAPGTPDSGDDALSLRLSFGLPVWLERDAARVRSARHASAAAARALDAERFALEAELERAAFEAEDAARQIVLYRDELLPRARAARDLRIADYRGGAATLLDVIDAERVELELLDAYARFRRDLAFAGARLASLIGVEL